MNMGSSTPSRRRPDTAEPPPISPPRGGRDRRALVAVASLIVICASVAAFANLYASAGNKTAAVVVDQALVQGQPITADQLGRADISVSSGVAYIPLAEASTILGKRAAAAVPTGSLLTPGDLTSAPSLPVGGAVVGLALKEGQFPVSGLVPGEQVMIVQTATPGSPLSAPVAGTPTSVIGSGSGSTVLSGSGTGVLEAQATVFAVSAPATNSSGGFAMLVSVEVPSNIAPDVATASSAGQVSLVLLAHGATYTPGGPAARVAGATG